MGWLNEREPPPNAEFTAWLRTEDPLGLSTPAERRLAQAAWEAARRLASSKGGRTAAAGRTKKQRKERAKKAADARWLKGAR